MSKTCLIIGASHAGAQLATSLRQEGWEGNIQVIGDESHLPYNRPPLSKSFLSGQKTIEELLIRPAASYEKASINFKLGASVIEIDRDNKEVLLEDGQHYSYDKLALTLGARVRKIPVAGAELEGVCYLRSISDVEHIREFLKPNGRVLIAGAGYIGLETAAMLSQIGQHVVVVEAQSRVLARVAAPEVSEFYSTLHRSHGVEILTGRGVSSFAGNRKVEKVILDDNSEYDVDAVVVGIGVIPNTELAEQAGLEISNGIKVDGHCSTSDPDIVAAGDCTNFLHPFYASQMRLESVQNAVDQAKVAAASLCGKQKEYNELPWFWSDQYDVKLQIAGLSTGYDNLVVRRYADNAQKLSVFYFAGDKLIAVDAINSPQDFMFGKRLIQGGKAIDPDVLENPDVSLRSLL